MRSQQALLLLVMVQLYVQTRTLVYLETKLTFSQQRLTLMKLRLEQMLIEIAGMTDERGLKIAVRGMKLVIPKELQFIAERVINSNLRSGTADNDLNAMKNMGMLPDGAVVNHFLTDSATHISSKQMHQTASNSSTVRQLKRQWKVILTLVTCVSKRVSVIVLAFQTGVAYSVHPERKLSFITKIRKGVTKVTPFFFVSYTVL